MLETDVCLGLLYTLQSPSAFFSTLYTTSSLYHVVSCVLSSCLDACHSRSPIFIARCGISGAPGCLTTTLFCIRRVPEIFATLSGLTSWHALRRRALSTHTPRDSHASELAPQLYAVHTHHIVLIQPPTTEPFTNRI
jgi:hypothetical protein